MEVEPNDTLAQAQGLTLAGLPGAAFLTGSVGGTGHGKAGDVDAFRLVVPGSTVAGDAATAGPSRLCIELTPSAGLALALDLTDDAGRPLEGVSGSAGEVIGMPNMAVRPGATYFVRVKPASIGRSAASLDETSHGYQLSLTLADFEPSEEREPNDRAEASQELAWYNRNADVVGAAGWRRDEDWYALSADGLDPGWSADLDVEGVEGVALSVTVYDSARLRLAAVRGRKGESLTLKQVTVPTPAAASNSEPGRWYVMVRAEAGQNRTQHYVLHVQAQPGGASAASSRKMETEPNDDPPHASPLVAGATTGYLPLGDVDFFTFVPDSPVLVTVEISPPAQVTATLEMTRMRDGQMLATATSRARRPARIEGVQGEPGQPLLIRLSQGKRDGNASQPYVLKLTTAPRDTPGP
jgi:hypothetical protein